MSQEAIRALIAKAADPQVLADAAMKYAQAALNAANAMAIVKDVPPPRQPSIIDMMLSDADGEAHGRPVPDVAVA